MSLVNQVKSSKKKYYFLFILLGLLAVAISFMNSYTIHMVIMVLFYGYCAYTWNFISLVGQLSIGQGAFIGMGAYVSAILVNHWAINPWLAMLVAGIGSVVIAVIIGYPSIRLRGPYFALMTIAFITILKIVFESFQEMFGVKTRGAAGMLMPVVKGNNFKLFSFASKVPYFLIILFMVIGVAYLTYALQRKRIGIYWSAMRCDEEAAESLGINIVRYRVFALLFASFLAGFGGAFYAQYIRVVCPDRLFGLLFSEELVMIGIIGGNATVLGPLLGSFLLTPIAEIARVYLGGGRLLGIHFVFYGVIMAICIFYFPKGIISPLSKALVKIQDKLLTASKRVKNGTM